MVESQHLMKNETIPPGAIHQCPASIPDTDQPSTQDLQCSCEHITAQDHHPHPGGDAPSPALSALPRTVLSGNLTDQTHKTKHPKAHTKILVKAVRNSCKNSGSRGGIQKGWLLSRETSTPCTLLDQQWIGRTQSHPLLWVIFWGPSFSPSATESSSPVDSVPSNPTLSRCSSGLTKIIRATTEEKHLLDLVFLVHKSARYFHLFCKPAFEFTATDASFDGKTCCWASKSTGLAFPLLLCGSVKETDL